MHVSKHNVVKPGLVGLATEMCRSHKAEFEQHAAHLTSLCVSCSKADAFVNNTYMSSKELHGSPQGAERKDSETIIWQII